MQNLIQNWPFWLSGIIIGIEIPIMYYLLNRGPGISSGFGSILKLLIPKTKLSFMNAKRFEGKLNDNLVFIIGIVLGGFLAALLKSDFHFSFNMGLFTEAAALPFIVQSLWFFVAGILLAVGARTADGCTSGNAIHGLITLQASGLVATLGFMIAAIPVTWLVKYLILGGIR